MSYRNLLTGKIIAGGAVAVFLAFIEFIFTMLVFIISKFPGLSFSGMILAFVKMTVMNLCVYIAVLPIIIFTGQRSGSFMAGVGFSFFYGFVGTFASGHGLGNVYPITAGLGIINYQNGEEVTYNVVLSVSVLMVMLIISTVMLCSAQNRVSSEKNKSKKPRNKSRRK